MADTDHIDDILKSGVKKIKTDAGEMEHFSVSELLKAKMLIKKDEAGQEPVVSVVTFETDNNE